MQKCFNTEGLCFQEDHYMVNLDERVRKIKVLVDNGKYFVINRARQYGKTTTLWALEQYLKREYAVVSVSFQRLGNSDFKDEYSFARSFARLLIEAMQEKRIPGLDPETIMEFKAAAGEEKPVLNLSDMFRYLKRLCATSERPVVLMVDEVDSASNNQVFLDFLAQLRVRYLERKVTSTFHSVILAGVYDIKNLKLKLRPEEEHKYNSPWNIAADFDIDMSFSIQDIAGMLKEYESDYGTGMKINEIAGLIYDYTAGYPYMVSYLCKFLDERLPGKEDFPDRSAAWTKEGMVEAVKDLVGKPNTLADDMVKKLADYPQLRQMMKDILFNGGEYLYNSLNSVIRMAAMFGLIKEQAGHVVIANRIMETQLYNLFLSEEYMDSMSYKAAVLDKNQFIENGFLNMEL